MDSPFRSAYTFFATVRREVGAGAFDLKKFLEGRDSMQQLTICAASIFIFSASVAGAAEVTVAMNAFKADGGTVAIGTVKFEDTPRGLLIEPNLSGLAEGQHGFHLHENGSCEAQVKDGTPVPGLGAGGHYDPGKTGKHLGPDGAGHLGDLPVLYVNAAGNTDRTAYAPRLKTSDLNGRAVVIHAGGDTYSDEPAPLGGGGARVACGVVVY